MHAPRRAAGGVVGYPAIQNNLAQCYAGARVPLLAARSEIKTQTAKGYKASGRARPRNIYRQRSPGRAPFPRAARCGR